MNNTSFIIIIIKKEIENFKQSKISNKKNA